MHAELSFTADPPTASNSLSLADDAPPCSSNALLLVTMKKIVLAHSHSLEINLDHRTLSLLSPSKISLTLTISDGPYSTGFFRDISGSTDEADARKWLAKQCGERLLCRSLTTGTVHDVRFLTSSTRSTSGKNVESLLETYAWLSVLKGHVSPSLARLSGAWTSILSSHGTPNAEPVMEIHCPDGHEYELDSDFDEDETVEPVASLLPGGHDSATVQDEPGRRTEGPFSSFERDGVSDVTSLDTLPEEFIKDQEVPPDSSLKTTTNSKRTVAIKFAAHRTWYAFLWYCYTGHIEFCELKSQAEHGVWRLRVVGDGPPSCSPKSIYRLADLVGDEGLKALALKAIKARMTKTNVLEETFSVFTSKYPDVRKAQLEVLMEHRASPEVKKAFLGKISESGVMPHAKPALEAFYDKLTAAARYW